MRPIRKVPSDYKNPALRRWRVMEVMLRNGICSRHVWGHDITNEAGRASSAIMQFNIEDMTATTHSGRIYQLLGPPGHAHQGEYAWHNWCRINGVISENDVTHEYFDPDKWLAHPAIEGQKHNTD